MLIWKDLSDSYSIHSINTFKPENMEILGSCFALIPNYCFFFSQSLILNLPLLCGRWWVVEPGQVPGYSPIIPAIASGDLQGYVLGYTRLHQTTQGVFIQTAATTLHTGLGNI